MVIEVTTQHNNNFRTGANLNETILHTGNVNVASFGRVFNRSVVGSIYAQPLYLSGVQIPSRGVQNVVYVATMHNYVYAFNADDPSASAPLWGPVSLGPPIALPDPNIGPPGAYRDISVEVGIVSTPVISRTRGVFYVVATTKEGGSYYHRLHALDLATGAEKLGGPQTINATVPGTGDGGSELHFTSERQIQRAGLLLLNDRVYLAFAAYGDRDPYHGWVLAYHADTLQQVGAFVTTPDGQRGGIWQAGQGPAGDAQGVYIMTGNGTSTPDGRQLGCAFIQLNPSTLQMEHWFAPTNWQLLDDQDADLGSGGVTLIPGSDLLVGGGKDGRLFVLRRGQLGDAADDSKAVDWFQATPAPGQGLPTADALGYHHIHGSPVWWEGPQGRWLYLGGEADNLRAFAFTGSGLQHSPVSVSSVHTPERSMPGAILSLSANGKQAGSGVLWASFPHRLNANQQVVEGILYALDASDLTRVLWHSKQKPVRDDVGNYPKFCPATVANGKVYLGTFSGPAKKVTLPGSAIEAPAFANVDDRILALAWTGTDPAHHLNVETSTDAESFASKVTLGETSPHGPALAFGNGLLFLSWSGSDEHHRLNVSSSPDCRTFGNKVTLSETSPFGPALAFGNGRLYLAWTGFDDRRSLNVMSSADGRTFVQKVVLGHTSRSGPSLAFSNGKLYLLWSGTDDNHRLNIMESTDGVTWTNKVTFADSSDFHPALAAPNGLYLAWTGRDSQHRLNLLSSSGGTHQFRDKQTYDDTSAAGLALTTFRGKAYVTWTSADILHQVNVARLSTGYLSVYGLL